MIAALNMPTPLVVELDGDYDADQLDALLEDVALELRFAGDPQRVVVDTRGAGRLPHGADIELMAFLLEHASRLERLAVVTDAPSAETRTAFLAMRSRREIRVFRNFDEALGWAMNP